MENSGTELLIHAIFCVVVVEIREWMGNYIRGNMNLTMYYTVSRNANGMHNVRDSAWPGR